MLIEPDTAYQSSYLAALDEDPGLRTPWTAEGLDLATRHDFAEFVRRLPPTHVARPRARRAT